MEITVDLIKNFKNYCDSRGWEWGEYTSEFTIQFRFSRFLDSLKEKNLNVELESNIQRYGLNIQEFWKKEIDIDILDLSDNTRRAVELKFIRNDGNYDGEMFSACGDIYFIEQLKNVHNHFEFGTAVIFTRQRKVYTENNLKGIRNQQHLRLHECFRRDFNISGRIMFKKKGNDYYDININGNYPIIWHEFINDIKYCIINVPN